MRKFVSAFSVFFAVLFLCACASNPIERAAIGDNLPPSEAFSNFKGFELKPVDLAKAAESTANREAVREIQGALDFYMKGTVANWNNAGAARGGAERTLVISPVVEELRVVSKKARFWKKAFGGDSEVVMRVSFVEKETGRAVTSAVFYSVTSAQRGAASYGGSDEAMLSRVANQLADYLLRNYEEAVGGPSGGFLRGREG